jgi:hypothetical protein
LSKFLLNKTTTVNERVGFSLEKMKYKDLDLNLLVKFLLNKFLTCKNRHLWRHHYVGAQGIIFVFSFKDYSEEKRKIINKILIEAVNIYTDISLESIPTLTIFDANLKEGELYSKFEEFRTQINLTNKKFINTQYIDFENSINEVSLGMEWLSEVMSSL